MVPTLVSSAPTFPDIGTSNDYGSVDYKGTRDIICHNLNKDELMHNKLVIHQDNANEAFCDSMDEQCNSKQIVINSQKPDATGQEDVESKALPSGISILPDVVQSGNPDADECHYTTPGTRESMTSLEKIDIAELPGLGVVVDPADKKNLIYNLPDKDSSSGHIEGQHGGRVKGHGGG